MNAEVPLTPCPIDPLCQVKGCFLLRLISRSNENLQENFKKQTAPDIAQIQSHLNSDTMAQARELGCPIAVR